jgi:hypothetical protein
MAWGRWGQTKSARVPGAGRWGTSSNLRYLLRDLFSDDRAAGSVNGTMSTDGKLARTVTDTANSESLSNGTLRVVGTSVSATDPVHYYNEIVPVELGRIVHLRARAVAGKQTPPAGFVSLTTVFNWYGMYRQGNELSVSVVPVGTVDGQIDGIDKDYIQILRSAGAFCYTNDGYIPKLVWAGSNTVGAHNLVVGYKANAVGVAYDGTIDFIQKLEQKWYPLPVASDSFNRADGAPGNTDGAGVAEVGGAGLAWSDLKGVSAIATNRLTWSSLTDGVGLSVVDPGVSECFVFAKIHRTAGEVGVVGRCVDADNYWRVTHDGTNVKLTIRAGGVENVVEQSVTTYVDDVVIALRLHWCGACAFFNSSRRTALETKYATESPLHGATKIGLYTTDTGNTVDLFYAFHTYERPAIRMELLQSTPVHAFGDSLTNGSSNLFGSLQRYLGNGYVTVDLGIGGQTTAQALQRLNHDVLIRGPRWTNVLLGTNDMIQTVPLATIQANLQSIYTQLHNAGSKVIAVTIPPYKGNAGWSAAKQIVIDSLNAWIMDAVNGPTNVDYRVDIYTPLEDPANPDQYLPAYDTGDHLHYNITGANVAGQTIVNAVTW